MTLPYGASDPTPWLPSVDVRADADDLILHAEMASFEQGVEVRCEGDVLIVQESLHESLHEPASAMHYGRLQLPFELPSPPRVSRPGPGILEVRIHIPT